MTTTGKVSPNQHTVVLRGVAYQDNWYQVTTADGVTGWVFGGAIRAEGEEKGNKPFDEKKFTLPYFGTFDLSEWKEVSATDEAGGDAEINTRVFERGGRVLKIEKTTVGEYGYTDTHTLSLDGEPERTRTLTFSVNPGNDGQDHRYLLEERVVDHLATPPVTRLRRQTLNEHYFTLGRPVMVNGVWVEERMGE